MAHDGDDKVRRNEQLMRGLVGEAAVILGSDRSHGSHGACERERAMWRLLDATIMLAESVGRDSVESGLSRAKGWVLERSSVSVKDEWW